ncbi:helix-turn-helix transcriptional regulator [Mycobacterium branderi]|uniref:Transcriptional regulator n=1 Tax=Mycobacterium branderi TaxID=43348 RepID=A0AA91RHD8_9MYCO|nr:HTH domain-containing protein [Mycobacterium branderi]ORA35835.1 transcriptional regulator [Mycobacterium branderi]
MGKQQSARRPRNRQRDRILQLVREHDGPVDAPALAEKLKLHVTTVRFHLDALCEQGVVARTRLSPTGVGRPRTGYIARQAELGYQTLAEILSLELGATVDKRRCRAERAGKRWAQRIAAGLTQPADSPGDVLDRRTALTADVFDRMGFGPELIPTEDPTRRTIRLHACPVRELAAAHPEVGCALHRGLLEGLLGTNPKRPALRAELEPFVEPELCIARVIAHD